LSGAAAVLPRIRNLSRPRKAHAKLICQLGKAPLAKIVSPTTSDEDRRYYSRAILQASTQPTILQRIKLHTIS
jgi:hypothetical protein